MKRLFPRSIVAVLCAFAAMAVIYSQSLPGTSQDRVGYPDGYQDSYTLLYILDRPDTQRILVTYGNSQAVSVQRGDQGNYPYGSIIAQETWTAKVDTQGN